METYCGGSDQGLDRVLLWRLAAAAVLLIAGLFLRSLPPAVSVVLFILSMLTAGYDWLVRTVADCLRNRRPDENLLMCLAVITAAAIGHAAEGALAVILIRLGDLLLCRGMERAYRRIEAMADERDDEVWRVLEDLRTGTAERSRTEESVAHFAGVYTAVVIVVAVVIAAALPLAFHTTVREGVYRALVLLLIACPCAVVRSVPLCFSAAIGGASGRGILFRSAAALEEAGITGPVVLDKSSALEGSGLRVVAVKSEKMEADVLLRIAAHACAYSDGVYAESIKAAYQDTIYIELIQSFQQDPGQGITVEVEGVKILLGLEDFVRAHGVDPGEDRTDEPCAYLAIDGKYAGRIVFGSVPRAEALSAVRRLSWERDRTITLVTEEPEAAAAKFARSIGLENVRSGCGPEEKLALVKELQETAPTGERIMFVGGAEGNEACLAAADTGVALGGSAAAMHAADIVVMENSLSDVTEAIGTARRTRTVLRHGLILVLAVKAVILILDMLGVCPLWLAVQADAGAALIAVLNALTASGVERVPEENT